MWNKLKNLKNNGTLDSIDPDKINKKISLFTNKINISSSVFNDIDKYQEEIEEWAEKMYYNPKIIINFIRKLSNFYLSPTLKSNHPIILWAAKFNSNFNKCLTDYTIEEKVLRSFLYGNPNQITIDNTNRISSIINSNLYNITFKTSLKKKTIETVSRVNDFIFYLNYEESNKDVKTIEISLLNKIKPVWLIPTLPLIYNSMFNNIKQLENNQIDYLDSYTINKLNKEFTNNWSPNYFVWNHTDAPILQYFYKSITKVITKLVQ